MRYVNSYQTPSDRRAKYALAKEAGLPVDTSRRIRDYTWPHLQRYVAYYHDNVVSASMGKGISFKQAQAAHFYAVNFG